MQLTEFENGVLGVVWRHGPCSAYAVQKNFKLVSTGWSASPGSVYPLMRKLCTRGLLARESQAWGTRVKSRYQITPEGLSHLRSWMIEVPDWAGRPPADAIRTRSFFLDALSSDAERVEFLCSAEAATRAALERLERGVEGPAGQRQPIESLAQLGGILQLKSRLEWLEVVRRQLQLFSAA